MLSGQEPKDCYTLKNWNHRVYSITKQLPLDRVVNKCRLSPIWTFSLAGNCSKLEEKTAVIKKRLFLITKKIDKIKSVAYF